RIPRLREAIGGGVWPARIALSAAAFQSVTTSAWTRLPIRSAAEADHERSLKGFIRVNDLSNKSLLAVAALGWRRRGALPCAAVQSLSCEFSSMSYGQI